MKIGTSKQIGAISIDLDNLWSYLRVRGDNTWETFPSYLHTFVPDFLDLLDSYRLKITFFVVGQDAAISENREIFREIASRGHELANHSFMHDPYLPFSSRSQLENDIVKAETAIYEATNIRPRGYRGPGYSWSCDLIHILQERGYLYDSTILPTFIGPAIRKYYQKYGASNPEARKKSASLFGGFRQGCLPLRPYLWKINENKSLLELPVSTIPLLRLPFHFSYLTYLSSYSSTLMKCYLNVAVSLCKARNVQPNFLIHPTDLLGGDRVPKLHFFPGMSLSTEEKRANFHEIISTLSRSFSLIPLLDFANQVIEGSRKLNHFPLYH